MQPSTLTRDPRPETMQHDPEQMPVGAPTGGLKAIRQESIDEDAAKVVRRLVRFGHEAYLVGGCVRDLLLGREPKDFDVATSATPNEIKKLFRNSRIIGRRFRLAHIFFGPKIIETSTFRAPPAPPEEDEEPIIRRDNVFGTAREDALRRDFTINGLFLDLHHGRVIDHVGGLEDLRQRRIRTIGEPDLRIQEDPVRTIRAVKFATRLDFSVEERTEAAMVGSRAMIARCSVARVLEELYRLLGSGHAAPALRMMHRIGVLAVLLPELDAVAGPAGDPRAREPVVPIFDRSGLPRAEQEPAHPGPRDAGPDPELDRTRDPTPEDLASFQQEKEHLVETCVGDAREAVERAGELTWRHLEGLDELVTGLEEGPSHALLLGATVAGLAWRQLQADQPIREAVEALELLVKTVGGRLRISRRDRERLKQILVAQRRMVHRGKRRRPTALIQREYFAEAWQLFQLSCAVTGENTEDLERWRQLMSRGARSKSRRGGRRRRGRRRRKDRTPQS